MSNKQLADHLLEVIPYISLPANEHNAGEIVEEAARRLTEVDVTLGWPTSQADLDAQTTSRGISLGDFIGDDRD